ncbi:MAG TPA: hypothetical protein VFQ39_00285, partial [Longimicrobium sp.]|nr:hypothetical protein [Longimicrobium sp.]
STGTRRYPGVAGAMLAAALAAGSFAACSDAARGVTAPGEPESAPAAAITTVGYTAVVGDDWKAYSTKSQLQGAGLFWWVDAAGRNVYDYVDLMPDPVFGQVVRITFPQNSGSSGSSPRIAKDLPAPLDRMWYRWRMKFAPGWTSAGPDPAGWANSYKIAFWTWKNYYGRGELEYSNTTQYITGTGVQEPSTGQYLNYTETLLAGSAADFGNASAEWTDGEWYEFVVYYEKTGATTANQHYWRRRLTTGGQVASNPWLYHGYRMSGSTTPQVAHVELGINRNKNNPATMYLYWGPWEVVDGSQYPNPFGMPNVSGSPPPTPTMTRLLVTPDTATLAPAAALQLTARAVMSDGTQQPATAAWTATGGTVTAAGAYTAPAAAGSYRVVATASNGMADTSTVTVAAPAPTLTSVVLSPPTASVEAGGAVQFTTTGGYSDGSSKAVAPAYTATGGTITAGGLYSAGRIAGSYRVIASFGGRADTSAITVTDPVAPPASGVIYTRAAGDDWSGWTASTLPSSGYFSGGPGTNPYANVTIVSDATYGKVARVTQNAGTTAAPRLAKTLPAALDRMWFRWRVRFSPGWTTSGSGSGAAEWTMGQWTWSALGGSGSLGFQNGNGYALRWSASNASGPLRYSEKRLRGSVSLGSVTTEWSGGAWWEYIAYWERTGATTGRQHYWRRSPGATTYTYQGFTEDGNTEPRVAAVQLGGNLGRAPAATQYVYWGPWEVVDGTKYPNPFGLPNF